MKKLILFAVLALPLLAGCDSGGSSGGSGSLDCIEIAGDYNVPIQYTSGYTENMGISVQANCKFAARSASTGTSTGKLTRVGPNTYNGTGKNATCPNGTFSVRVVGSRADGISFLSQCN